MRGVLVHGEDLLEQSGELCLAKNTARLDVGQQVLEVAHALRQRLHFAQAFVYLLEPVRHLLEAFTQPCFQRGLEFFIDGGTHFVELGGVAGLQLRQLCFECLPHFGHAAGVRFTQARQLQTQGV